MMLQLPVSHRRMTARVEIAQEVCTICGSHYARRLFAARDRLHNLPGEFWVVRCVGCKLLRTSPRLSGKELAAYYPDDYGPHRDAGEGDPAAWVTTQERSALWRWLRRRVISRRIWWTPDLPPGARVLELGSGGGQFVRHALARDWEVHALEPAGRPAERLALDPRVRVHTEAAEQMAFAPGSFDAVFAWMVVEHLEDPAVALRKISMALKPGGHFVFSVPNAGSWEFFLFRERWYALQLPTHLWHFSPRTLRRLLSASGLAVERVYHQKVLKNLTGSLDLLSPDLPRLAPLARRLERILSNPWISFAVGAALAGVRQGGRLTVVARAVKP